MTNNHSERALRFICGGRKAWLFFGSDDHASAAANLFSLIASCKLHDIDAETYLVEIINLPALLAARALPRARTQVLARDACPTPSRRARPRDRTHHRPAAAARSERDRVAEVGRRELPRRPLCVMTRSPSRTALVQRVRGSCS